MIDPRRVRLMLPPILLLIALAVAASAGVLAQSQAPAQSPAAAAQGERPGTTAASLAAGAKTEVQNALQTVRQRGDEWVRAILPEPFFRPGPKGLMWWQWLAFPVLALGSLIVGRPLGALTRRVLHRLTHRTATTWDERLLARVGGALTMFWALVVFRLFLPWLMLGPDALVFVRAVLAAALVLTTFWALWRSVGVFVELMLEQPWAADNPSARSLISVAGNLGRVSVALLGVVSTIAALGYPVATVLAGLGIGGIALAFGAQKTVENLFGSVAIAADQPLRVGDTVKVEDFVGTVERIGTRSTQIRTLDRTIITIPNGRLSDMRIETFAVRDRIRFATTIGISYGVTEAQLTQVIAGMEAVLRAHPRIWPDTVIVRFQGFSQSSLDIEVLCWFETADFDEFRTYRQEALFGFMRVIEAAGASFAFPTRTVHLVTAPGTPPPA